MQKLRLAVATAFFSFVAAGALAEDSRSTRFWTGNDLYESCRNSPERTAVYVAGVIDGMNGFAGLVDVPAAFCLPEGANGRQVVDMSCSFAEQNPDLRHNPASIFVGTAMMNAFPCDSLDNIR